MKTLIVLVCWAIAGYFIGKVINQAAKKETFNLKRTIIGAIFLALPFPIFWVLGFSAEMFWYDQLGYSARFWKVVWLAKLTPVVAAVVYGLVMYLLTLPLRKSRWTRIWPEAVGALTGLIVFRVAWQTVMQYLNGVDVGTVDPIFGKDIGFYLFTLPIYNMMYWSLMFLASVLVVIGIVHLVEVHPEDRYSNRHKMYNDDDRRHSCNVISYNIGWLLIVMAFGFWLDKFDLLTSSWGSFTGVNYVSDHVRIPAYGILQWVCLLAGILMFFPALLRKIPFVGRFRVGDEAESAIPAGSILCVPALLFLVYVIGFWVCAPITYYLKVKPNEYACEEPYIKHNIAFTRAAFNLGQDVLTEHDVKLSDRVTAETVQSYQDVLSQVRLLDWRPHEEVLHELQRGRTYYRIGDVDVDRYWIGGKYTQVMIGPREMDMSALPDGAKTFINTHMRYTHGLGVSVASVSDFEDCRAKLLVRDVPPKTDHPELTAPEWSIYFGELTDSHVYVNTTEQELHYEGDNVDHFSTYQGLGGVPITSFWRRLVFAYELDGLRLFTASAITPQTRVMYQRNIFSRAKSLAPFLTYDQDPYVVIAPTVTNMDGTDEINAPHGLFYIMDAYTSSTHYPYSEPYRTHEHDGNPNKDLDGVNYVRNSVKVVVDAYNGTVKFYISDPTDPIIQMWSKIFPGMFLPLSVMPSELRAHIRYPEDIFNVQARMYARYHMTNPSRFYSDSDRWVRATETYHQESQHRVQPYYIMWRAPESQQPEYVIMAPFTPKDTNVMVGWLAARCDQPNYGQLLAYKFPKEQTVLGPQQFDARMDQHDQLSALFSLWDQKGSTVIRGNVLVIPLGDTYINVKPIYLQAQGAKFPELKRVVVGNSSGIGFGTSLSEALDDFLHKGGLRGESRIVGMPESINVESRGFALPTEVAQYQTLATAANKAFEQYLKLQGEGKFVEAAQELEKVRGYLQQLTGQAGD